MQQLNEIIRFESANSALAFRMAPYGVNDREALLKDVIALANAPVSGPRHLVIGAADEPSGKRKLKGVRRNALAGMVAAYQTTIADYVVPPLKISMRSTRIKDRTLAVIVLRECDQPPYLLGRNLSTGLQKGDGWVRRGRHQTRLSRADLESMFGAAAPEDTGHCEIQVAFDGAAMSSRLELPAMSVAQMPSQLARKRIQDLLETKQAAHNRLGRTDTWLDRLSYARVHGADQPYEAEAAEVLLSRLSHIGEDNEAADRYYENELRAHKINLLAVNFGDGPLKNAKIVIDIPAMDGVAVADRIYAPLGVPANDAPNDYPAVEFDGRHYRIASRPGRIDAGERQPVFRQPLRLLLRPPAAGRMVNIGFTVTGDELDEPASGSLHLQVTGTAPR